MRIGIVRVGLDGPLVKPGGLLEAALVAVDHAEVVETDGTAWIDLQRALEINPGSAVSLDYLGVINRDKGRFKEAAGFYQRAIEADPNYAYAHRNYGILLELYMGKLKQALAQYEEYQKLTKGEDKQVAKWIVDLSRRSGAEK